jgi:cobalt-zinc-cadmium efflux system membrane fusion protein
VKISLWWWIGFAWVGTLSACKEAPAPAPEAPAPIVQEGRLRFAPGHPQLALLTTVSAKPATSMTLELPARLVWNEERTQRVVPSFAGKVGTIAADVGQMVRAGAVLAEVSSPDFGAAQADAAKALADVDLSRKALARQTELFEAGIVARKDLEQAQADAQRANAEWARARARTELYGAGHHIDQRLALRSTLAGVVVERNLNPGQDLRPDPYGPGVAPLFVISDPSSLWVQIDVRESEVPLLRVGSRFVLNVAHLPSQTFEGRVTVVGDAVDPTTRTVKVRGVVANPKRALRAEMLATAQIERPMGPGVTVPATSVALRGTQHVVYLQTEPGVFERREVSLSYQGSKEVVVAQGLSPGNLVVADNLLLLARAFRLAEDETKRPASGPEPRTQP